MAVTALRSSRALPDTPTLTAFATVVLIAGGNLVAVRVSNAELAPFFGAGIRFAAAAVILGLFLVVRRIPLPRGGALLGSILYGLLGFGIAFGFGYWALQELPAGVAGVILASVPIITLFLVRLHGLEPLHWRGLLGGALTIGGVWVLLGTHSSASLPLASVLAMFAGAACMAEGSVLVKRFPPCHPTATNAIAMAIAAVVLIPLSLLAGEPWFLPAEGSTWAALGYLVLIGSVGLFAVYLFVLERWTASGASYQFVLMPFSAALLGAWVTGEPITSGMVTGGAIVLLGVYLGALSRPKAAPPAARSQEALAQRCATT